MSDSLPASKLTLATVDFFPLIDLPDLSQEEKDQYIAEGTVTALQIFMEQDVPALLSADDLAKFQEMATNGDTKDAAFAFLIEKVPNYQEQLQKRILEVKKQMIIDNIEERLKENKVRGEMLREDEDNNETRSRRVDNETYTTTLQKALKAIEEDNWDQVWHLLVPSS